MAYRQINRLVDGWKNGKNDRPTDKCTNEQKMNRLMVGQMDHRQKNQGTDRWEGRQTGKQPGSQADWQAGRQAGRQPARQPARKAGRQDSM
jgi:hypothetical protein